MTRAYVTALLSALVIGLSTPAALSFSCQSGTIGQGSCSCSGSSDCTDMRHSKMCKTDLNCSQGKCSCTAAIVAGGDGGGTKGVKTLKAPKANITNTLKQK